MGEAGERGTRQIGREDLGLERTLLDVNPESLILSLPPLYTHSTARLRRIFKLDQSLSTRHWNNQNVEMYWSLVLSIARPIPSS